MDGISLVRNDGRILILNWEVADSIISCVRILSGVMLPLDGPITDEDAAIVAKKLTRAIKDREIGLASSHVDCMGHTHGHCWDVLAFGREIVRPLDDTFRGRLNDLINFLGPKPPA